MTADNYKPQFPRIMVRLSQEEREAVLAAAEANGITISELVREALRQYGLDIHATSTKGYNHRSFFESVAYSREYEQEVDNNGKE